MNWIKDNNHFTIIQGNHFMYRSQQHIDYNNYNGRKQYTEISK